MSDFWRQWENHIIDARFPLRRFLDESSHSAVFLTEYQGVDAAVKVIRADSSAAGLQLERWHAVTRLSHPHLIRLFASGYCKLGNHELLFVVMEYAEQTLAEILTLRPLSFDEVRQMSGPAVAALSFLHRNGWVHGQLKPSNVCVVNDELKLASDTSIPAGEPLVGPMDASAFKAPEENSGSVSAAGDIWSLGMSLVAALNQHPSPDGPDGTVLLPSTVPPAFAEAIGRCLSRDPAQRPTADDLRAQLVTVGLGPPAPVPRAQTTTPPSLSTTTAHRSVSRTQVVGGLIVSLGVIWAGARLLHGRASPRPSISSVPSIAPVSQPAPQPASRPARGQAPPPAVPVDSVLHREIPVAPHRALRTIRGRIQVLVTVTVDSSGNVIDEATGHSGSSKYFTKAAASAARKWRFAPAAPPAMRRWILRFEFTRDGASASASPA